MDENQNVEQTAEEVLPDEPQTESAPEAAEAPQAEPQPEVAAEPSELEKAQAACAKEHDNYLRLAAEYDNFRKRSQKEKDNLYTQIRAETVGKFLPVFDNLERALAQETADEAYRRGVEMIMSQFLDVLKKLGAAPVDALGQRFDPTLHNAIMHTEDPEKGEGEIVEEFQKGFKLGDKVIRFAMVKVAN